MSKVFSDEYVQTIKRRYEYKSDYERPDLYRVAVSDECQYLRSEIEEMVAALSLEEQEIAIPRLTAEKNFLNTYNELAVGCLLRQLGCQVEYDKQIEGLTPDWYVYPKGNIPEFIVEVFTTTSGRKKRSDEEWQIKDLEGRLGKIAIDATLRIMLENTMCNSGCNKGISKEIQEWLLQKNPLAGTEYVENGFSCKLVKRDTGISNVKAIFGRKFLLADTEFLVKTIKMKIGKYKSLHMPLVVAVVTDAALEEEIKSILVGSIQVDCSYDKITGLEDTKVSLLKDGLFNKKTELSAVVLVSRLWNVWKISAIYNPSANRPLPYDTFGEKECPIY